MITYTTHRERLSTLKMRFNERKLVSIISHRMVWQCPGKNALLHYVVIVVIVHFKESTESRTGSRKYRCVLYNKLPSERSFICDRFHAFFPSSKRASVWKHSAFRLFGICYRCVCFGEKIFFTSSSCVLRAIERVDF